MINDLSMLAYLNPPVNSFLAAIPVISLEMMGFWEINPEHTLINIDF
jgi:hypothetical protein